jgi:hypothetical protein
MKVWEFKRDQRECFTGKNYFLRSCYYSVIIIDIYPPLGQNTVLTILFSDAVCVHVGNLLYNRYIIILYRFVYSCIPVFCFAAVK